MRHDCLEIRGWQYVVTAYLELLHQLAAASLMKLLSWALTELVVFTLVQASMLVTDTVLPSNPFLCSLRFSRANCSISAMSNWRPKQERNGSHGAAKVKSGRSVTCSVTCSYSEVRERQDWQTSWIDVRPMNDSRTIYNSTPDTCRECAELCTTPDTCRVSSGLNRQTKDVQEFNQRSSSNSLEF